jgi:glucokinase
MAAGPAIAARARAQISGSVGQKLVELAGSVENISAFHVGQAAQQGDPLGVKLIEEAGTMVGFAVVNIMSLFNPEIVIIGGGVSSVGNLFFDPIKKVVRDNLHEAYWADCPIVPVTLGDDVGLLGGVALLNSLDENR